LQKHTLPLPTKRAWPAGTALATAGFCTFTPGLPLFHSSVFSESAVCQNFFLLLQVLYTVVATARLAEKPHREKITLRNKSMPDSCKGNKHGKIGAKALDRQLQK
jgi:hypothetical protein